MRHREQPEYEAPSIRLASNVGGGGSISANQFARFLNDPMNPEIRLAHVPGAQGDNVLLGQRGVPQLETKPALLVSYVYLNQFLKHRHRYAYRDWVMDSGAFSAYNKGAVIDLQAYIEKSKELFSTDPTLSEIFSLDVIGDWRTSLKNTEEMWKQGVPAIPCFHNGEPWDVLVGLARDYFKIALGGVAMKRKNFKHWFANQCFSRVWKEVGPTRIHGFGFSGESMVMGYPLHSVDATNWEVSPCKFGRWYGYGGTTMSVRGSRQNLRIEVEHYLKLERKARQRWAKEMAKIEESVAARKPAYNFTREIDAGNVRLAIVAQQTSNDYSRYDAIMKPEETKR